MSGAVFKDFLHFFVTPDALRLSGLRVMACRPDKAFTPHPALCASNLKLPRCSGIFYPLLDIFSTEQSLARKVESVTLIFTDEPDESFTGAAQPANGI
ncbi:hypothetical protein ECP02989427_0792, partial [Escherichia coli P0298942.7]